MMSYKPHYACFDCRKVFKRRLPKDVGKSWDEQKEARCPQCGNYIADMGLDFAAPKKDNSKAWEHLKTLYAVGITFHSCGCTGPGYVPNTHEGLVAHFNTILRQYEQQLNFWRNCQEPITQSDIDRDKSKNWEYLCRLPLSKKNLSNETAKQYWFERIREVQAKINLLKAK